MEDYLYHELETNREQGLKLLSLLEDAKLISMLKTPVKALKHLSAPDKLYLDNPNMMYALSEKVDIGTVRETFFNNQLSVNNKVSLPPKGDFKVDDSFLAIDSVEIGNGNRIPLWLFGFLS